MTMVRLGSPAYVLTRVRTASRNAGQDASSLPRHRADYRVARRMTLLVELYWRAYWQFYVTGVVWVLLVQLVLARTLH